MQFLHVGVPTQERLPETTYIEAAGVHVTDPSAHPQCFEYVRFEHDSILHESLRRGPHVAYQVDDIVAALAGEEKILNAPMEVMPGVTVAFLVKDGVNLEYIQLG